MGPAKVDSMLAKRPDLVALLKQDDLLTERARLLGAGALLFERGILTRWRTGRRRRRR